MRRVIISQEGRVTERMLMNMGPGMTLVKPDFRPERQG